MPLRRPPRTSVLRTRSDSLWCKGLRTQVARYAWDASMLNTVLKYAKGEGLKLVITKGENLVSLRGAKTDNYTHTLYNAKAYLCRRA